MAPLVGWILVTWLATVATSSIKSQVSALGGFLSRLSHPAARWIHAASPTRAPNRSDVIHAEMKVFQSEPHPVNKSDSNPIHFGPPINQSNQSNQINQINQ